ncbi:MAG: hypothetical protein IJ230_00190 [Clostridia bacterium]|nr:hypothetical protein [Clostridia bacterium]
MLEEGSKVNFKVQLRSIEDEYYVAGDENHNFAKHDEDHTEAGRLSAEDIEELTVECDLQTVGKTPKAGSSPGQYSQSGATNGIQTYVFNTQNILDEIIFPHAGWYVFDISEDTGSFVVNNETLETAETKTQIKMVADADTHYTMKVYVENQGTDNQLVVTNATVRRGGPYTLTYNDDGTVKTRTLGAPGAEDADSTDAKVYLSKDRDQNGVTFQNEYLVPEDGQELEISKVVDVETEDSTDDNFQTRALNVSEDHMDPDDDETALIADQSFHFNAVISIPEELTDLTGGFIALDSSRIELSKTDGTTSSQITVGTVTTLSDINGSEDQAVLQLRPGETAKGEVLVISVKLKHGETLKITGLPAGASYIVREDDARADGTPDEKTKEEDPFRQSMTKGTSTGSIGDSNNAALEIQVTNTKLKKEIPLPEPEGLTKSVSLGLAGALIAAALLGAGAFFLRSKLKEEEQ